jgi:phage repressor protein C with HTH and peptisase S24 domain
MAQEEESERFNPDLEANMRTLLAGAAIGATVAAMAERGIKIGGGTLHRISKGRVGSRLESLQKVADYFNVTTDQLLAPNLGRSQDTEYVDVPRKRVALSAGPGREPHLEEDVGSLKFRADFLRAVGASRQAAVVDVVGQSMEPTIPDGAVVLISTGNKERVDRRIVALRIGAELFVKRLVRHGEQWVARSDNEDKATYPDIPLDGEHIEIIGRAVWMGARL